MSSKRLTVDAGLEKLQHESFNYFLYETNAANGLVIDKTETDSPASIAATGLALASYPVAVERGFMPRAAAVERTLTTLRFFWNSPQGPEPDATGYRGFYYHFLDMQTGRRAWQCELSTVDSAFLLAGALTAGMYFEADTADEHEIRALADALYRRADWQWAQDGGSERQFFDYAARGVPYGPDDGTIAPWALAASLPFAPEIVLPVLDYCMHDLKLTESNRYGFKASFNPTYPAASGNPLGWVSPWYFGLNEGPTVLMIENYRTGLLWRSMRNCPYIVGGLRRAGFRGGWL